MKFDEIRPNNRLQIECERDNPAMRSLRGIVLDVSQDILILVTDYGELVELPKDKILSITKITFDKYISEALTELKNHYNQIYETEQKTKELKTKVPELISKLYDANFLAKFNIYGAKTRLENSINPSLLNFKKDNLTFKVTFEANQNDQIELNIRVFNSFEYYNLNKTSDVEKIIRVHAPDVKDAINKAFVFKGEIKELDKKVMHEVDNIYSVSTLYVLFIDVTRKNFLKVREEIIKGLERISSY